MNKIFFVIFETLHSHNRTSVVIISSLSELQTQIQLTIDQLSNFLGLFIDRPKVEEDCQYDIFMLI